MRHWSIVLAMITASPAVLADNLTDHFGPRELATGESMRGGSDAASATLLNPAGLSLSKRLVFEATFGVRRAAEGLSGSVTACDSKVVVSGCYYYRYFTQDLTIGSEEFTRRTHEFGVTLARAITPNIHLGATARYFDYESDLMGDESTRGYSFDAGLVLVPSPAIRIGAVGYNLVADDSAQYPRAVAGGIVAVPSPNLRLGLDGVWNVETDSGGGRYSGGAEYFVASQAAGYPIRAGVVYDAADEATSVTGGLGYMTPKIGIDLGVSKQVDGGGELIIQAGLRLFGPS